MRGGLSTVVAGFCAGVLGGAYNTNGPPIVVYGTMRGWEPERFKATLQGFFLPTGAFIIAGHALSGLWTRETVRLSLVSLAPVALGMALSFWLAPRIPRERFGVLVHVLLLACAALLIWRGVTG
ncbi:MAG: TSUP family transporter [Planctomycetota bacterium]